MIRIHYIPPTAPPLWPDLPADEAWGRGGTGTLPGEQLEVQRGRPSRLSLERVGRAGARSRLQADTTRLSAEWQSLARRAGHSHEFVRRWQEATSQLDAEGAPSFAALRQARAQLRAWYMRQTFKGLDAGTAAAAARVDAQLSRLLRRDPSQSDDHSDFAGFWGAAAPLPPSPWERLRALMGAGQPYANAGALHRQGLKLHERGRSEAALAHLEAAASKAPDNPQIQLDWGRVLTDEGYFHAAESALRTACALAPRSPAVRLALGQLFAQQDAQGQAIEAFEAAVGLAPKHTDALTQLGVARYDGGRVAEAAAPLQRAVALDPHNLVARFYLAQIALQQHDMLRARYQLAVVRQLAPDLDMERFGLRDPRALASGANPEEPHRWQMPREAGAAPRSAER